MSNAVRVFYNPANFKCQPLSTSFQSYTPRSQQHFKRLHSTPLHSTPRKPSTKGIKFNIHYITINLSPSLYTATHPKVTKIIRVYVHRKSQDLRSVAIRVLPVQSPTLPVTSQEMVWARREMAWRIFCLALFFDCVLRPFTQANSLTSTDPFAEADEDTGETKQSQNYIHIRIQRTFDLVQSVLANVAQTQIIFWLDTYNNRAQWSQDLDYCPRLAQEVRSEKDP